MVCIHGNDCRQGAHQDAQKSKYTTRPRSSSRPMDEAECAAEKDRRHAHRRHRAVPIKSARFGRLIVIDPGVEKILQELLNGGPAAGHLRPGCNRVYFVLQSRWESSMENFGLKMR